MLTSPDFKEKQILFIQSEKELENGLRFYNENVVYSKNGKVVNRASCHRLLAIFIVGDVTLTTALIRKALSYGISIFLLKNNLKTYAAIDAKGEGNYLLRMRQYNYPDEFFVAKQIVKNKIDNQIALLKEADQVEEFSSEERAKISVKIDDARNIKELLGIEGSISKKFFHLYFVELKWYKRMPQTKVDIYNLLLDMGYSFLFNYLDSLIQLFGFDTYKGFYHQLFFQRKSLVCDLMEPFRCLVDKQLLKSFHLEQIHERDFDFKNGRYSLKYSESGRYGRIFLEAILARKEDVFNYIHGFYRFIGLSIENMNNNNETGSIEKVEFPYFRF